MGFIVFIMLIVGIVFFVSKNTRNENRQTWQNAANQLGLVFNIGSGSNIGTITGWMHGHHISISTFTRGSGNSSQIYTKYTLEYLRRIPVDFKIVRQGITHCVGKVFGLQDIEVGDMAFDDQVLLLGARPEAVIEWLKSPGLRDEIRVFVAYYPDVVITNDLVTVNHFGTDTGLDVLAHTVRSLVNFCDVVTNAFSADDEFDSFSDATPKNLDDDLYEPVVEPGESAFNRFAPSNSIAPEPVWAEVNEKYFPEEENSVTEARTVAINGISPAVEAVALKEYDESVTVDVADLKSIATELSGGGSGQSLNAEKIFEQKYKGCRVKGSGVLRRVSKFSYDPVFKNCRGVKATLDLCELAGSYSTIKVSAVIKCSEEDQGALEAQVDATLPIAGTLVAFDSMMNHYFIESYKKPV